MVSSFCNTPTITNVVANEPHNINVSDLVTGQYVLRWTTISGSTLCPDSTDEITIDVYKAQEPIAAINECQVTSVLLEATEGTTGVWSLVSINSNPPTPAEITAHTPAQSFAGSSTANANVTPGNVYVYEYTTNYPVCANSVEQVTATIKNLTSGTTKCRSRFRTLFG